jgi:NAD+ diphosphatase
MVHSYYPESVFKFCPRCGSAGFRPDSVKSILCNACGFRYFINPVSAVTAIISDTQNRVLFTRRRNDPGRGMLDLPGGFVDRAEKAEQALIREIHEELNLTIDSYEFYGTFPNEYLFEGIIYFTLDSVFICEIADISRLQAADDVVSAEFINPGKINPDDIGLDSVKNIVKAYLESYRDGSPLPRSKGNNDRS